MNNDLSRSVFVLGLSTFINFYPRFLSNLKTSCICVYIYICIMCIYVCTYIFIYVCIRIDLPLRSPNVRPRRTAFAVLPVLPRERFPSNTFFSPAGCHRPGFDPDVCICVSSNRELQRAAIIHPVARQLTSPRLASPRRSLAFVYPSGAIAEIPSGFSILTGVLRANVRSVRSLPVPATVSACRENVFIRLSISICARVDDSLVIVPECHRELLEILPLLDLQFKLSLC